MSARSAFSAAAFLLASSGGGAQEAPQLPQTYREEARVERVVVDAYVTDKDGQPIPDLKPSDFRVKVDGHVIPPESADWVPAEMPEASAPPPAENADASAEPPAPQ